MICPYCHATVLSTSQPIKEATLAQHFDLPKGEPARFVRNGILETCQCRDCVALAQPASPLRGIDVVARCMEILEDVPGEHLIDRVHRIVDWHQQLSEQYYSASPREQPATPNKDPSK